MLPLIFYCLLYISLNKFFLKLSEIVIPGKNRSKTECRGRILVPIRDERVVKEPKQQFWRRAPHQFRSFNVSILDKRKKAILLKPVFVYSIFSFESYDARF